MSHPVIPPAVAATDRAAPRSGAIPGHIPLTAPAETAGGRGYTIQAVDPRNAPRSRDAVPVGHVDTVDGWALLWTDELASDGFYKNVYIARSESRDVWLDVSPYDLSFSPTNERFAFLVRGGFPRPPRTGPWSNDLIDAAIAAERKAA